MKEVMSSSTKINRQAFGDYFQGIIDNSASLTTTVDVKVGDIDWSLDDPEKINSIIKWVDSKSRGIIWNDDFLNFKSF